MDTGRGRGVALALFAAADFRRLWLIGAIANVARWLELLAGGLFLLDRTGSAGLVALVAALRALPLLLFGPLAGALAEALDRRLLLALGLGAGLAAALAVAFAARAGVVAPWHLGLAAFVAGLFWSAELPTRRRMLAEAAGPAAMAQAIALDATTNATTRMLGPVCGGFAYAVLGLDGAHAVSAALAAAALLLTLRLGLVQRAQPFRPRVVLGGLAEATAVARAHPAVLGVLAVTVVMNTLGFSYLAIVAPLGRERFAAGPLGIGLLAAAEPAGALVGGLVLGRLGDRIDGARAFRLGSLGFLAALAAVPAMPALGPALALLAAGGLGIAAFGTFQTALVLAAVPAEARSRMLGLVTTAIGTGPLGMLAAGALAERFGAGRAVTALAAAGFALVAVLGPRRRHG